MRVRAAACRQFRIFRQPLRFKAEASPVSTALMASSAARLAASKVERQACLRLPLFRVEDAEDFAPVFLNQANGDGNTLFGYPQREGGFLHANQCSKPCRRFKNYQKPDKNGRGGEI